MARTRSQPAGIWPCLAAVVALAAATLGQAQGSSTSADTTVVVRQETVNGQPRQVLTDAQGMTLYFSTLDTPDTAKCTGSCTQTWKPLTIDHGKPTGPSGIGRDLTTLVAPTDGMQVEYKGHPLYTYAGDRRPGDARGVDHPPFKVASLAIKSAEGALGTGGNSSAEGGIGSMGGGH